MSKKFDVVLCFGVLHHLQNPHKVLSDIRKLLKSDGLFLCETLVLDDSLMKSSFMQAIEPKDIIYRDKSKKAGFLGIKLESSYFPGSTHSNYTVTIPSLNGLELLLQDVGFEVKKKSIGFESYIPRKKLRHRKNLRSEIIVSIKKEQTDTFLVASEKYEDTFCLSSIAQNRIESLLNSLDDKEEFSSLLLEFISKTSGAEREILESVEYSPKPKLLFEYSKNLLREGKIDEGTLVLKQILEDDFCEDWRVTYRSLFLLSIYEKRPYAKLARRCNPEFPKSTIAQMHEMYKSRLQSPVTTNAI